MSLDAWVTVLDVVIYVLLVLLGICAVVIVIGHHLEHHEPNDDYGYPEE